MRLSREQRRAIFEGETRALTFTERPAARPGQSFILSWSRARRYVDETGRAYTAPAYPLVAITVTAIVRRAKGGWAVRFDLYDGRHRKRLVRATPPVYAGAPTEAPSATEIARAREEGSYTSNPAAALDHLEAVEDAELARDYAARRVAETIERLQRARRAQAPTRIGRWAA